MQRLVLVDGITKSTVTASIDSNLTVGLQYFFDGEVNPSFLVYNGGANAINPNMGCTPSLTGVTTGYSVTASSVSGVSPLAGVPYTTIAAGSYGWIQSKGYRGTLLSASAIVSAGLPLLLAGAGSFSVASMTSAATALSANTQPFCGVVVSTTTAARGSVDAVINGLYG